MNTGGGGYRGTVRHPTLARVLRVLLGVLATVLLAATTVVGGVAATVLAPTPTETANYRASLQLSLDADDRSRIQVPTVFGDIDIAFASPLAAPGVQATVQVRPEIISVLARPNASVLALQPSPQEISNAVRSAVMGLAVRYVLGSLAVLTLALLAYAAVRRRRPGPWVAVVAGIAWVVATASTGSLTAATYQPSRYVAFNATSVLGTVQQNTTILGDVQARADQTTPYLKNLLALSNALQDRYEPEELNQPVAARVLMVSDIHGANQYALMRAVVETEQIDAVLDTGDLVNFGTVTEADAANLFTGIESLGVPYLFTDGNHDATSPTDDALLRRLADVPNVVLLQPDQDSYQVENVNGVRIAGFNDPRYYGDDDVDNAAEQKPAAAAYLAAMGGRGPLDLVASHEPAALTPLTEADADLRVHGHIHSRRLQGTLIGVGTFTGGGPLSHFNAGVSDNAGDPDAELEGQPSSFDIATFGRSCRLTQLARYTFRNVIEGRPAYDDVSLINGSRIELRAQAATGGDEVGGGAPTATSSPSATVGADGAADGDGVRVCSSNLGVTTERVPAAR